MSTFFSRLVQIFSKNGIMFVATLKLVKSYLFAIIGAEYLLRWRQSELMIGKIVKPDDLISILAKIILKLML